RNAGMSSGACCPSPSIDNAQVNPRSSARLQPAPKAAPFPRRFAWRITSAPHLAASSDVPSLEPSSTTITTARYLRTASTSGSIVAASFRQGITTAHCDGQSTTPTLGKTASRPRQISQAITKDRERVGTVHGEASPHETVPPAEIGLRSADGRY